jgi:hypothetical protein
VFARCIRRLPAQAGIRLSLLRLTLLLAAGGWLPIASADVIINELMTSNGDTLTDENGDSPDWFELFNPGPSAVPLAGWGVSDSPERPFKWTFAHGVLGPGDFLLVYASGKDRQSILPAPAPPPTLPGLVVWLRASTVDAADATQVRRAGNQIFVRRWRNQAATDSDAVQATSTLQPLWLADGGDGHPVLRFDGSNDQLNLPSPPGTNSFSLFAVFRTSQQHESDPEGGGVGGTSGQRYLFGARHGGDSGAGMGLSVGTNGLAVYEHGSGYMPALAAYRGPLGTGWVIVAVDYANRQPTLDVQGLVARAGPVSSRGEVTAPFEIGAGAYGAFGGDLAEVVVFNRSLTATERRHIASHFAEEYDVELPTPRHSNFELSAAGEELVLTRPGGTTADRIRFGPIERDLSFGRQPDGGGDWYYFEQPTPGTANLTPGTTEWLAPPAFSHPAGFYTNDFELRLEAPAGAEVRYTLDGAEPDAGSPLYLAPLAIRSRTGTPNDLSRIPTVPGGPVPAGEVFKGWVVRARTFKDGARASPAVTRTFWVTPRGRDRYSLPVVSLATARSNFFAPDIGIYIPGLAAGGNYSQRGPEWERPVHVEFHETNGAVAFAQDGDVKIHGNTSQGFPIKGLDLDGTGGRGRQPFRHRIFPDRARTEFEHVLLRPTGHDQQRAFMRDEMMQSLAAETGAESQAARACVVFLNGEYWGLHYLKEKEDAEFVGYYGDVPLDRLDYLEGYAAAKAGDTAHYEALLAFLAGNELGEPDAFAEVSTRLDVPNYIDYKVCEVFFYRWDIGNHRLWRPRTPEGRWRWLQFDNDVGWGGFWAESPAWEFNMLRAVLTPDGVLHGHNNETTTYLLRRLVANPGFRRDFINRFCDLLNTTFTPAHTLARIEAFAAILEPEMAEHTRRWRAPASLGEWQTQVRALREYAERRPAFARLHLQQQFNLRDPAQLTVSVSNPQAGQIRVNTLSLDPPPERPWTGSYFQGHSLSLTAVSRPGYRFAGWRGLLGVEAPTVTLRLNGDLAVQADFVVADELRPSLRIMSSGLPGMLALEFTGPPGATARLDGSRDLDHWEEITRLPLDDLGKAAWPLRPAEGGPARFYRLELIDLPANQELPGGIAPVQHDPQNPEPG